MTHLHPHELLDVVEQSSNASSHVAHLENCAICRDEVRLIREMLDAAAAVESPEPSPLFWEAFSARVHEAIAAEPSGATRLAPGSLGSQPHWLHWRFLVPCTGLALVVVALMSALAPSNLRNSLDPQLVADLATLPVDISDEPDAAWTLIADLVGPLDYDEAREAGIATAPGTAEDVVPLLSADEQQELVRLIRQELEQPGG